MTFKPTTQPEVVSTAPPTRLDTATLPAELVEGLTIYHDWGGAQIRIQATPADDTLDLGTALAAGRRVELVEYAVLAIAHRDDAPRSPEDGNPWILDTEAARALRDLLNIATARGFL